MDLNIDYYHKERFFFKALNKFFHLISLWSKLYRISLWLKLRPLKIEDKLLFPKRYYNRKINDILSTGAEYICFSLNFTNILTSVALAKRLKKIKPGLKIIFGGFSPQDYFYRSILKSGCADHIVVGEGEEAISAILKGKNYKDQRIPLVDIDEEPTPDFSVFDLDKYLLRYGSTVKFSGRGSFYQSTRGCKNFCTFCNENSISKKYRLRSIKKVVEDIKIFKKKYNFNWIFFSDCILLGGLKEIDKFCDLILESKIKVSFGSFLSLREYDPKVFRKMHKAGFEYIFFGVESASQRILNLMKKGTKIETIEKIIRSTSEAGIKVKVAIIVGYLTETWKDYYLNIKFLFKNIKYIDDLTCNTLIILVGTEIYKSAKDLGIKLRDIDTVHWTYKWNNYPIRLMKKWTLIFLFKLLKSISRLVN